MFSILLTGFASSIVQIIAIGAQNTFILKSGLSKNHIFLSCIICSACDILLITLSIFGVAQILASSEMTIKVLQILGILFLTSLGIKSIIDAFKGSKKFENIDNLTTSRSKVVITALLVSLLNPQALFDTIVIIGSLSSQYELIGEKFFFYLGSIFSSIVWFFVLGYGSRILLPIFQKPICWKILDLFIGAVMFILAYKLI